MSRRTRGKLFLWLVLGALIVSGFASDDARRLMEVLYSLGLDRGITVY